MTAPLGPFRLTARILSSPAGIVYAALDPAGRPVQVALLTRGAASDPAARDRFAAAVRSFGPEVLAADTDDQGPWVIGTGGLAGLLEPVLLRGEAGGPGGPQFLHHWAGRGEDPAFPTGRHAGQDGKKKAEYPTFTGSPGSGGWSTDGTLSPAASRALAVLALLILALLLAGVVVLLVWLLRSQPAELPVEPVPTLTTTEPGSPTDSPGPSGSSGPPTPDPSGTTPVPTGPGTGPTPGTTPWPDDGGDNPL
ncbi:hypothetical protein [Actinocorallia populi]|uniref:hypothetical protein n=1 Tax=Actinocorallia populi TaxID=2079200 RepID=UPI0018E50C74|nr:hypothetical protein [Actinocorallia populi]